MGGYSVIYSFGDSLSDAGDAYLLTSSPYGSLLGVPSEPVSPPYAQETYGTTTANVFSNGMVWVQDLAATLGLANPAPGQVGATGTQLIAAGVPSYIVSALDEGNASNYITIIPGAVGGTDFAIGGSVTGPTDFNTSGAEALTDLQSQIANFQHEIAASATDALYTVWSGSNDLLNLLGSSTFASQSTATSQAEVAQSAQNEVDAVISLAGLGAKTVLVGNVPNLGLIPAITAQGEAAEQVATAYAQFFNLRLQYDLQAASSQLAGVAVTILDTFGLLSGTNPGTVVPGPNGNTITDTTDPAYTGSLSTDNGTLAANADNYLYFDEMHPTQTGHQAIANLAAADLGVACYCTGTRIRTARGEVAVEELQVGDEAVTPWGESLPVTWIGHRGVDCERHPHAERVLPVWVREGAFGGGLPARDLWLSPDHAVFMEDVLIPIKHLINGVSIAQVWVPEVTYWHVELPRHDVILAEGLPAESYLDTGNRLVFENGGAALMLHPEFGPLTWDDAVAPLHQDGPVVERVLAQLAALADQDLKDAAAQAA